MTVVATVPLAGEVQPAAFQSSTVLKEHLVEVRIADYPVKPVACHVFVGYAEVGGFAQNYTKGTVPFV